MTFIHNCRQAREERKNVPVTYGVENGLLTVGHVTASAITNEFLENYGRLASLEQYRDDPLAFCDLSPELQSNTGLIPGPLEAFYHAVRVGLPFHHLKQIYSNNQEALDCTSGTPMENNKNGVILRMLLNGSLPREYIASCEKSSERPISRAAQCMERACDVDRLFDSPDDNEHDSAEDSDDIGAIYDEIPPSIDE